MEKIEVWKDVVGYEGLYQVSSFGRVKRLKNGKERILKPILHCSGYLYVNLFKNKIHEGFRVHRLVAMTFIPNLNDLPQVNHKDENKMNNHAENLEWCDAKYNTNFGTRTKKAAEKLTNGKLSRKINQYTLDGEFVQTWPSMRQVERELGISQSNVC